MKYFVIIIVVSNLFSIVQAQNSEQSKVFDPDGYFFPIHGVTINNSKLDYFHIES